MENDKLVQVIFRSFRISYLKDTVLQPTMDESSLSTLGSLLQFTHSDVVGGVTCSDSNGTAIHHDGDFLNESTLVFDSTVTGDGADSYLVNVLRALGMELRAVYDLDSNLKEYSKGRNGNNASSADDLSLNKVTFPDPEEHDEKKYSAQNSTSDSSSEIEKNITDSTNPKNNILSHWK